MVDELLPADKELSALREEVKNLASEISRLVKRIEQLERLRKNFETIIDRELNLFKHRLLSAISRFEE